MGKDFILKLASKFGLFGKALEFLTELVDNLLDKNEYLEIITDTIAAGGTLRDVISAVVDKTPTFDDDDADEIYDAILASIKEAIDTLDSKSLLDIILSIKVSKDLTLGKVPIPDFDDNPDNNILLGKIIKDVLD